MRKQSKGTLQFTTFRKKIVLEPELEQMFQSKCSAVSSPA